MNVEQALAYLAWANGEASDKCIDTTTPLLEVALVLRAKILQQHDPKPSQPPGWYRRDRADDREYWVTPEYVHSTFLAEHHEMREAPGDVAALMILHQQYRLPLYTKYAVFQYRSGLGKTL
jgi:hypothetical protein